MLAVDQAGDGPPLLLLHGTTSSRRIWRPLLPELAERATVLALDLPGHGDSPPTSFTPPQWASEVAGFLDQQGIERTAVVGHSAGGWTALELAKLGRRHRRSGPCTGGALAQAVSAHDRSRPQCQLASRSPFRPWRHSRASLPFGPLGLASRDQLPARQIPADVAVENARAAIGTDSFPRHFAETRRLRFEDGTDIGVPVRVIWGGRDRIALPRKSRNVDRLPPQVSVETWGDCGHMLMWDAPQRLLKSIQSMTGN